MSFEDLSTSQILDDDDSVLFSTPLMIRFNEVDELFREVRQLNRQTNDAQARGMDAGLSSAIQILRGVPPDEVRALLCLSQYQL